MLGLGLGLGIEDRIDQPEAQASGLEVRSFEDGGVVEAREALVDRIRALGRFYYDASIVYLPHAYSEGKMYCIKPNNGDADLTMTHAGTNSTRVNPDGLVQDSPKNLLRYSEQFDNAAWTKTGITTTANDIVSPDGATTADKLEINADGARFAGQNVSLTNATVYQATCYLQNGNTGWGAIAVFDGVSDIAVGTFNLATGVVGSTNLSSGSVAPSISIEDAGNGWYRCILQFTSTSTGTWNFRVYSSAQGITDVSGVIGEFTYAWGAQFEQGSEPTDYLRTTDRQDFGRLDYLLSAYPVHKIEPARTNLLTYSEQFDNAAWTKLRSSISANATTSPDGSTTADRFSDDNSSGTGTVRIGQGVTGLTSSQSYTLSIFAKSDQLDWIVLNANNYDGAIDGNAFFDLANGVVGTTSNLDSTKIESYGDGWYRCSITFTMGAATTSIGAQYFVAEADNDNVVSLDSTSSIYIWGAQLEVGTYATSYIPTVASTVTRSAETLKKTGIASLLGDSEGTLYFEGLKFDVGATSMFVSLSDGTLNNRVAFGQNTSQTSVTLSITLGGVSQVLTSGGSWVDGQSMKIAIKYSANDFALWVNGVEVATENSGSTFGAGVLTQIQFNAGNGSIVPFYGNVKALAVWDTALTDEGLAELTSYYTYDYMAGELGYTID